MVMHVFDFFGSRYLYIVNTFASDFLRESTFC